METSCQSKLSPSPLCWHIFLGKRRKAKGRKQKAWLYAYACHAPCGIQTDNAPLHLSCLPHYFGRQSPIFLGWGNYGKDSVT